MFMSNGRGCTNSRARYLLLTTMVVLGLTIPTMLVAGPAAPTQASITHDPGMGMNTEERTPRARKRHKQQKTKKQRERKKDRRQKTRTRNRNRQRQVDGGSGQPAVLPTGVFPAAAEAAPRAPDGNVSAENRYIVRLNSDAEGPQRAARTMAREIDGVEPTHVYRFVFEGYAALIPPDKLDEVRNDPRVAAVVPDFEVSTAMQTLPTGIRRISAGENSTAGIDGGDEPVDVDVAVVDTAGNDTHEDLNIHAWANCTPSPENADDVGHGTFVGGVIGARDNGVGVVGVAPGARIWNIRVVINRSDGSGTGLASWTLCGLDLITRYATPQADGLGDIEVANFSITSVFEDTSTCLETGTLYHQAYCAAAAAGVTLVAGAGNSDADAAAFVPASYDEVITVSALADSNGVGGVPGAPTSAGPDESLATFSNWGADVDIAAPGVDILSTVPTGSCTHCDPSGYVARSGTSASSPHVAGAAALYLANHPGASPAEVKVAILAAREAVALSNDPDGIDEGVLYVGPGFG